MTNLPTHAGDLMAALVQHMIRQGGEHSIPDLASATGMNRGTLRVYLRRALHYGFVENPRRGVYVSTGRTPLFDDSTPKRHGVSNYAD